MKSLDILKNALIRFALILFVLCTAAATMAADTEQTVIKKYPSFAPIINQVKEAVRTKNFELLKSYTLYNAKAHHPYWLPEYQDEPDDITYAEFISNMTSISEGANLKLTGKYELWEPSRDQIIDIETIGWKGKHQIVYLRFMHWDNDNLWSLMGIYLTSERMK